jgi:hypothetical protein
MNLEPNVELSGQHSKERPAAGAAASAVPATAVPAKADRDLRLDLFRGIALWLIFLDHIPNNFLTWFTIRNYGFSDAAEIFIFISGYTAAFVYGTAMIQRGFIVAGARILKRAWQIYVAHVFLFSIYIAAILYVASSFENPLYAEEMNALDFLKQPEIVIVQALLLKFKPVNMDVLPLYIVLLLLFPVALWLLVHSAPIALGASVLLYVLTWQFGWNFSSYPSGHWYFNPYAWQLLFVFGAWCALGGAERLTPLLRSRWVLWLAVTYLVFAFAVIMTWHLPRLAIFIPRWLGEWMYPIDKINLDVLRFLHFLALAALTVRFVSSSWPGLQSVWFKPAVVCGQHSLEIFCLGVFLAFAAHFMIVEFHSGVLMQVATSIAGILIMVGTAVVISWYRRIESRGAAPRRSPDADLAGGQA